jgi:hypothetical protein
VAAVSAALATANEIPAPVRAMDLKRAGLRFTRNGVGHLVGMRGPRSVCAAAAAEIDRRAADFRGQIPDTGRVSIPRLPDVSFGACDACGDPLPAHWGGMCSLCVAAWRKALQIAGRLP